MSPPRIILVVLSVLSCGEFDAPAVQVQAGPVPDKEVSAVLIQSRDKRTGNQARQYEEKFYNAIDPLLSKAMTTCTAKTPDTVWPGSIAFIIAKDGRVKRIMWSGDIPMGACVGEKLRSITKVPPPPEDNWVEGVGVANHSAAQKRTKTPVDRPIISNSSNDINALDKAIAPYVAKARATYPQAKARFQAGLPQGYQFSVWLYLYDPDGTREGSFIDVKKIAGGRITGTLSQADMLKTYKAGQTITIKESDIQNWLILRPDGTEEGNYVGKFLDHYKAR
jgi:hypothetical protein